MRNALLLAAALLAAPAAAMAEGISYTYIDGRYFSTDSDAMNVNLSGGAVEGSVALGPIFFIQGSGKYGRTQRVSDGVNTGRFNGIEATALLGAHHALTSTLDIVVDGGGLYSRAKGTGGFKGAKEDDFGYLAEAGLRLALVPQFEVGVFGGYRDVGDVADSFFAADLQYLATSQFSLIGGAHYANKIDTYSIGVRYRF